MDRENGEDKLKGCVTRNYLSSRNGSLSGRGVKGKLRGHSKADPIRLRPKAKAPVKFKIGDKKIIAADILNRKEKGKYKIVLQIVSIQFRQKISRKKLKLSGLDSKGIMIGVKFIDVLLACGYRKFTYIVDATYNVLGDGIWDIFDGLKEAYLSYWIDAPDDIADQLNDVDDVEAMKLSEILHELIENRLLLHSKSFYF